MTTISPITDYREPGKGRRRRRGKRSVASKVIWSLLLVILIIIIAAAAIGAMLIPKGLAARDALENAIPLADQLQSELLDGESDDALRTVERMQALTSEARTETETFIWKSVEWVPFVGDNLKAVRIASVAVDDIVTEVLRPAASLSLDSLKPQDGAINIDALTDAAALFKDSEEVLARVEADLNSINRDVLIDQVASGVDKLDGALEQADGLITPLNKALEVLPAALGAEEERNYLILFQNNAESRGTGGNPAALVLLTADEGRIEMSQNASSSDFNNGRPEMITEVDPETVELYGTKIARYMQDVTLTPSFPESATIMSAFWDESFGTPVDGVVSFDPVALSYLMEATGPITISTREVLSEQLGIDWLSPAQYGLPAEIELTSENVVSVLLNEVYFMIQDPALQDAFFAAAASQIFDEVTSGSGDTKALFEQIVRSVDEGRLMYAPNDAAERDFIAGTRIAGTLPENNEEETVVGVYVNDVTEGKLNYYMQLDIAAESTQCTADVAEFVTTATVASVLQPEEVPGLATYISPGRYFPKGDIVTELVMYGPVGSTFESATVNDASIDATALPHLDRPAVMIRIHNQPATTNTVQATFTGATEGEAAVYGPLEVRHTPMVRETEVELAAAGCE